MSVSVRDLGQALEALRWFRELSATQSRLLALLEPYRQALDLCAHLLEHSDALRRGELVLTEAHLTRTVRAYVADDRIHHLEIRVRPGHLVPVVEVARLGLHWTWTNACRLVAAELNQPAKSLAFACGGKGRVRPANWLAKAARFLPGLLLDGGMIMGWVSRAILDHLAREVIHREVEGAAVEAGVQVDGQRWTVALTADEASRHPVFQSVSLGPLGEWRVLGDVLVIRKLELGDGQLTVGLGFHPRIWRLFGLVGEARRAVDPAPGGQEGAPPPKAEPDRPWWKPRMEPLWETVAGLGRLQGLAADLWSADSAGPGELADPDWLAGLDGDPADVSELAADLGADAGFDLVDAALGLV